MNTTASVDNLWNQFLALSRDKQKWLANKIYEHIEQEEKEPLPPYTIEEINSWLDESEVDAEIGRSYTCAETKHFLESKHPWLCRTIIA